MQEALSGRQAAVWQGLNTVCRNCVRLRSANVDGLNCKSIRHVT
jgi:hypothetical protein